MVDVVSAGLRERVRGRRRRTVAFGVGGILGWIVVWQVIAVVGHLPQVTLPTPVEVGATLVALGREASTWNDVLVSLQEVVVGYLVGSAVGYMVGALLGVSQLWRRYVGPVVEVFRFVIPFSWIPLTVLWFGTSLTGKEVLVGYAVFFVMAVSVEEAVRSVDPALVKVGRMVGMSRYALIAQVQLRASLPRTFTGLRVAIAVAWISLIAAEYVGSSAGLGFLIVNAEQQLQTSTILAGMVFIGVIGSVLSIAVGVIGRRVNSHG